MKIENVKLPPTELDKILEIKDVLQVDRSLGAEHGVISAISELDLYAANQFNRLMLLKDSEATTAEETSACTDLLSEIGLKLQRVLADAVQGFQGELGRFQQSNLVLIEGKAFDRRERALLDTLQGGVETYQRLINTTITTALRTSTVPPAMPEVEMQAAE